MPPARDLILAFLGLLVLGAFWWALFALMRLFGWPPKKAERADMPPPRTVPPEHGSSRLSSPSAAVPPCCCDCTPDGQVTGLAMGQAWDHGDDWWGEPVGERASNAEAMVFWGDDCCIDCARCPICRGG